MGFDFFTAFMLGECMWTRDERVWERGNNWMRFRILQSSRDTSNAINRTSFSEVTCDVCVKEPCLCYLIYWSGSCLCKCKYTSHQLSSLSILLSFSQKHLSFQEMGKMLLAFAILLQFCYYFAISADAFAPSGWMKGHATFYGGSDASGTMGM